MDSSSLSLVPRNQFLLVPARIFVLNFPAGTSELTLFGAWSDRLWDLQSQEIPSWVFFLVFPCWGLLWLFVRGELHSPHWGFTILFLYWGTKSITKGQISYVPLDPVTDQKKSEPCKEKSIYQILEYCTPRPKFKTQIWISNSVVANFSRWHLGINSFWRQLRSLWELSHWHLGIIYICRQLRSPLGFAIPGDSFLGILPCFPLLGFTLIIRSWGTTFPPMGGM